MVERPILRFPEPINTSRPKRSPSAMDRPLGPDRATQGRRFQATFDRLANALGNHDPLAELRQDPLGIAPERALVFVIAGNISDFSRVAREAGLEVFSEEELEETEEFPEGFEPAGSSNALERVLYATIPTIESLQQILSLWGAHQREEAAPRGASPWWRVFDLLLELRVWGPQDRLGSESRSVIEERLAFNSDDDPVILEFEIWPTASTTRRAIWRAEVEQRVADMNGSVRHQSTIVEDGFTYEALLVELSTGTVREMLANPSDMNGLAVLDGIQFILPQTIAQAVPDAMDTAATENVTEGSFDLESPIRVALLDGTPVAAHHALDGGVVVEDLHDLVRMSPLAHRFHATAMASLILRGDLQADGTPLTDTRLISVPILIDAVSGATSDSDRLFVDVVHNTLVHLIGTASSVAPDVFVINFSIGIRDEHFSGRISALARLLDWWSAKEGVLFVVSSGNTGGLFLAGRSLTEVEDASNHERMMLAQRAIRDSAFNRTLLPPSESINALTVGALSLDLTDDSPPAHTGILSLEAEGKYVPQMTSALGLGYRRSIKPDVVFAGGRLEVRAVPNADGVHLTPLTSSNRTGLVSASPPGQNATARSRGTSSATALVTRSTLQAIEALTGEGGPFEGIELSRRQNALLARALAVNSARWPQDAFDLLQSELERLGHRQHLRAKEEVSRFFGYGYLETSLMKQSPESGVTLVGLGSVRKDGAQIFRMPAPPSLSGERLSRSMRVTLAWFSPIHAARAQYRLAALEATTLVADSEDADKEWGFAMKSDGLDSKSIGRGSIWSKRLTNKVLTVPSYDENREIAVRVHCRDSSGGGLNPDEDIMYAIAVALQVEAEVQFDIQQEVEQALLVRLRQHGV